jgi:hypothetical protein
MSDLTYGAILFLLGAIWGLQLSRLPIWLAYLRTRRVHPPDCPCADCMVRRDVGGIR